MRRTNYKPQLCIFIITGWLVQQRYVTNKWISSNAYEKIIRDNGIKRTEKQNVDWTLPPALGLNKVKEKHLPNVLGECDSLTVFVLESWSQVLCPSKPELDAIYCGAWGVVECVRTHYDRLCVCVAYLWLLSFFLCTHNCPSVCVGWQRSQGNCPVKKMVAKCMCV